MGQGTSGPRAHSHPHSLGRAPPHPPPRLPQSPEPSQIHVTDSFVHDEHGEAKTWHIRRRYKDFTQLNAKIKAEGKLALTDLPPPGKLGVEKALRVETFMAGRKEGLERYLGQSIPCLAGYSIDSQTG